MWRRMCVITMLAAAGAGLSAAQTYEIDWYTVDGGGVMFSSGGIYELGGTIGQPDAANTPELAGGEYSLAGGFWVDAAVLTCGGYQICDLDCNGSVNQFDIQPFVEALIAHAGCSPCAGDTNEDGTVNTFDINGFIACLMP